MAAPDNSMAPMVVFAFGVLAIIVALFLLAFALLWPGSEPEQKLKPVVQPKAASSAASKKNKKAPAPAAATEKTLPHPVLTPEVVPTKTGKPEIEAEEVLVAKPKKKKKRKKEKDKDSGNEEEEDAREAVEQSVATVIPAAAAPAQSEGWTEVCKKKHAASTADATPVPEGEGAAAEEEDVEETKRREAEKRRAEKVMGLKRRKATISQQLRKLEEGLGSSSSGGNRADAERKSLETRAKLLEDIDRVNASIVRLQQQALQDRSRRMQGHEDGDEEEEEEGGDGEDCGEATWAAWEADEWAADDDAWWSWGGDTSNNGPSQERPTQVDGRWVWRSTAKAVGSTWDGAADADDFSEHNGAASFGWRPAWKRKGNGNKGGWWEGNSRSRSYKGAKGGKPHDGDADVVVEEDAGGAWNGVGAWDVDEAGDHRSTGSTWGWRSTWKRKSTGGKGGKGEGKYKGSKGRAAKGGDDEAFHEEDERVEEEDGAGAGEDGQWRPREGEHGSWRPREGESGNWRPREQRAKGRGKHGGKGGAKGDGKSGGKRWQLRSRPAEVDDADADADVAQADEDDDEEYQNQREHADRIAKSVSVTNWGDAESSDEDHLAGKEVQGVLRRRPGPSGAEASEDL